jgi:23S rRNA (uracil1939-C5)-methyltransferase
VDGVAMRVSNGSFFQSSPQGAALLVDAVRRSAPEIATAGRTVDAYGGIGLFALTVLAPAMEGGHITIVESHRRACADAQVNIDATADPARHATIEVVASDFGRWRPPQGVDVLVADPSRTGLGKPGAAAVIAADPELIVLISCDPVSLARDAALLVQGGYQLEVTEVIDLFPQTPHVETVSRLVRAG